MKSMNGSGCMILNKSVEYYGKSTIEERIKSLSTDDSHPVLNIDKTVEIGKNTKLEDGVINVIIEFAAQIPNEKNRIPLIIKIASHWTRMKVKTIKDAINIIEKEINMYQKWVETTPTKISVDKDKVNKKIKELIQIYNSGDMGYAIGGLETLSHIYGIDLLDRYGLSEHGEKYYRV